ncbi:M23 family metallopeptidase [Pasteuria penetrans]|uniref:M23 family metallopeptidase n=1 Tax=Pasteuria penetrans TaxID=86005 RepID=UPI000FAC866A|nr:M23 family metallopeptidase [Pasteuria penetrans]
MRWLKGWIMAVSFVSASWVVVGECRGFFGGTELDPESAKLLLDIEQARKRVVDTSLLVDDQGQRLVEIEEGILRVTRRMELAHGGLVKIIEFWHRGKPDVLRSLFSSLRGFLSRWIAVSDLVGDYERRLVSYEGFRHQLEDYRSQQAEELRVQEQRKQEADEAYNELTQLLGPNERKLEMIRRDHMDIPENHPDRDQKIEEYKGENWDGRFCAPVVGARLSSGFGTRGGEFHRGVDLAAPMGTPIYAAAAGKVVESRPSQGYGHLIVIDHGGGWTTRYAHMYPQYNLVRVGDRVGRNAMIAKVGSSGGSTGPHLHWEVYRHGQPVNPGNLNPLPC